jgi:hypothetical protein
MPGRQIRPKSTIPDRNFNFPADFGGAGETPPARGLSDALTPTLS